ncbi:MAG: Lrp/AsnC family transcriptional regulator [Candidatus Bathyarchaeia archaeon]|jgi:Lrp/AsnC family transcriptional regulator for asnA, asnC and gidA
MKQIDEIDAKILTALLKDSREKLDSIAKGIGISPTAVAKRIEDLRKQKVIAGTRLMVRPQALGLSLTATLVIKAKVSNIPQIMQSISTQARSRNDFVLTTCQSGIGHFNILAGFYAKDKHVLDEILRFAEGLQGVTKANMYIWLDEIPFTRYEGLPTINRV